MTKAFTPIGEEILSTLPEFTGSETMTRHGLVTRILMSEGVIYLSQQAGAYWLTDVIASHQLDKKVRAEEVQVWKLQVREKGQPLRYITSNGVKGRLDENYDAVVTMTDGNTDKAVVVQRIPYTDFPLSEITIWFENNTMFLPSER